MLADYLALCHAAARHPDDALAAAAPRGQAPGSCEPHVAVPPTAPAPAPAPAPAALRPAARGAARAA